MVSSRKEERERKTLVFFLFSFGPLSIPLINYVKLAQPIANDVFIQLNIDGLDHGKRLLLRH